MNSMIVSKKKRSLVLKDRYFFFLKIILDSINIGFIMMFCYINNRNCFNLLFLSIG